MVEYLLCKHETLSSNLVLPEKNKQKSNKKVDVIEIESRRLGRVGREKRGKSWSPVIK
jgi:hypothetical protein